MHNPNPLLNTTIYGVEFPDREIQEYAINLITENMHAQVDLEGYQYQLLHSIVDYKKDTNAIATEDLYLITKSGQKRVRKITSG